MRVSMIVLAAMATVAVSGAREAHAAGKPKSVKVPPAVLVDTRRAAMMLSGADMAGMKGVIDRGEDPKSAVFAASALAAWAAALPGLFPAGSVSAASKAKPDVWADRAGFEAAARSLATDATQLRDLARASDKAGFAAQWTKVRGNCQACHDKYRLP
jgi:cytochrome c556